MAKIMPHEAYEEPPKKDALKALPTRYKVQAPVIPKRRLPVFSIQDSRLTKWSFVTSMLAVFTVFCIPFLVAFTQGIGQTNVVVSLEILIDLVYMFDIVISFRTSFINRHTGDEIFEPRDIAKHYLISGKLLVDILAAFPFDHVVYSFNSDSSAWRYLAFLRVIRVYRLQKLLIYLRARDEVKLIIKFFQLMLYLIMYVHVVGCLWFMLISQQETWLPPADVIRGKTEIYNSNAWDQYWFCFYHSVYLLCGIEILVSCSNEYAFAVSFYICGAIINAIVIGEMAVISSNLNRKATRFGEIADNANTTMKNMKLPNSLQLKIFDYLIATQNILEFKEELEAFEKIIPPSVQQEVRASIYKGIVQGNSILSKNSQLAEAMTRLFKSQFCQPDESVVSIGEESSCMYFIASGKCEVEIIDPYKKVHLVRYLRPGDYFGELGLVYNTKRSATVKTSVYSNIAIMSKSDFRRLADKFVGLTDSFKERVSKYNDPYRCFLINCLNRITYFKNLPVNLRDSLIYSMESCSYDTNISVLNEGDFMSNILIVAEGSLSVSFKIKTRNPLIIYNDDEVVEGQSFQRKRGWNLLSDQGHLLRQQTRSRLIGNVNENNAHYSKLCTLKLGAIIGIGQVLVQTRNHLRITAEEPSVVLKISLETIERLSKGNTQFRSQVESTKKSLLVFDNSCMEELKRAPLFDCLPLLTGQDIFKRRSVRARYRFQNAMVTVIKRNREIRMTGIPNIANFILRLRAVMLAEDRGLHSIARDIAKGDIDPDVIHSADLLNLQEISKPLLNKFAVAAKHCKEMMDFLNNEFGELTNMLRSQKDKIEMFSDDAQEYRDMVVYLERHVFSTYSQ